MKIKQLIEELQKYNVDKKVYSLDDFGFVDEVEISTFSDGSVLIRGEFK